MIYHTEHNDESRQPESAESGDSSDFDEGNDPGHPDSVSQFPPVSTPLYHDTSTQKHDITHGPIDTERQHPEGDSAQYWSDPHPLE